MKIKLLLLIPFLLMMTSSSDETYFWGQNGHRVTGKIAEKHLTRKTKKCIDKILKGQSLAFVSTYADEIKSDRKYRDYNVWHYVNMDLDQTYEQAEKNPQGDLVQGIEKCIAVLKDDNSADEDKVFHLKMLVHLVGDLHQPMHIGRKEDKGGNDVQVQWFGNGSNLHRVWDTNMIADWNMSYIELAENADDLSKKQIEFIEEGSVVDWVNEVHEVTKEVYKSVKVGENLRYNYSYDHFGTVRTQLQKGGIRLAKVLNDIYD
ncbi:S1/P1 Nuclease [Polaribacter vadi]|uniref:S1/P1 Nuclease n=1 Tax=Polaribacter vadi TaxID=1774273 RepID=A0A1B8TZK1_9FLAO|nr:S1/P1 nuclease [Polaribacter vadi]AOW16035.1 S1/P1 Nuclease [Polaribacter vadi]OBY65057.1 S1/P1 Nuclease [Polaribacter vadi]